MHVSVIYVSVIYGGVIYDTAIYENVTCNCVFFYESLIYDSVVSVIYD